MYGLRRKLYTNYTLNYTLNPTQRAFKTLHGERSRNYTRSGTRTLHFVFEREWNEWNFEREWSKWNEWSESYVTFVTNVTNVTNVSNVRNVKQEMAIGGDATRHSLRLFLSPSRRFVTLSPPKKSNNFESIFSDSTLTFLTFGNTFRLLILPSRRAVLLCLPLI